MTPIRCGPMLIAYPCVHERYRGTRDNAHHLTMKHLAGEFPGLLLTNIDEASLQAFEATWVGHLRHPRCRGWDWLRIVKEFNANPKQFQMAVWKQDTDGSPGRENPAALRHNLVKELK